MKAHYLISGYDMPVQFGRELLECRRANTTDRSADKYLAYSKLHSTLKSKLQVALVTHVLKPETVT
jgi:hypothetical protein